MTLVEFQFTSTDNLTLKVLPLTDDLIVDLQDIFLQHPHLFTLHLLMLGYNLRVLKDRFLTLEEYNREAFKGDKTTFGPL